MPGLTILGAAPGADAAAVAAAAGGERFEPWPATAASPLVAAQHAGAPLDPPALLEDAAVVAGEAGADGLFVAVLHGGLLAPVTARYSARDLARELGAPVVVAASGEPGATALVRLTVEGLRGAGLRVAGVVLTGWPDPPDRVRLDERRLLAELLRVDVHALGERALPVAEWVTAGETAAPAPAPAGGDVVLDPYEEWAPRPLGDPRETPRPRIMEGLLDIVAAEGPVLASRAYGLYVKAGGGKKVTTIARAPLLSATHWLAQERRLVLVSEDDAPWQGDAILRTPDQPEVRVRTLGPRALDEVPLDEVAELVRRLRATRHLGDDAAVKRAVLQAYGLVRLTARADEYLGTAIDLAA